MKVAVTVFAFLCGIAFAQAMTTVPLTTKHHHGHHDHDTKPTHEPDEKESFSFSYDHTEHVMVVKNGHSCYVANLSADEQMAVHTDTGIRALELKLLAQLSTATNVDGSTFSHHVMGLCRHASMLYTIA